MLQERLREMFELECYIDIMIQCFVLVLIWNSQEPHLDQSILHTSP